MLIGYAWVSTAGESLDLQREALDRAGVDQLFADVACRAAVKRPQLEQALFQLRKGGTLVVWQLDRLGRSVRHLTETVEALSQRGIGFRSLKENIDTTTAMGKRMFHAFGWRAEFERGLIREQTGAGRVKARTRRRRRGPLPKLDETKQALAVTLHQDPSNSIDDICQMLQIGQRTLYRYLSKESGRKTAGKPKAKTAEELSTPRRK